MAEKFNYLKRIVKRFGGAHNSCKVHGTMNVCKLGLGLLTHSCYQKLYTNKEDQAAALKRHLKFFNTHPYVAAPIMGVTLALEEEKANVLKSKMQLSKGLKSV